MVCIGLVRHRDLVKEIGQTCDWSATVRLACRTLNRRMVTAGDRLLHPQFNDRKLLGIIYRTLKNKWVFEDFPNFVLAEARFAFGGSTPTTAESCARSFS